MRMAAVAGEAWAGIDVGKTHHWVCVVDADGRTLLSVKVANDEAEIAALIAAVTGAGAQLVAGRSTSSARRRRCCWRCWPGPASRCVTRRAGWSRR